GGESGGSLFNKVIYTISKNVSSFSGITFFADGCIWTIAFEDGSVFTGRIPSSYTGSASCSYPNCLEVELFDAYQVAVCELLKELDFDDDGLIDVSITGDDLQMGATAISGIPFPWSTNVQVRRWA
ncbi:MAG: hypothetical protein KJ600_03705, partial [Nanoarchaeota archaeon]|nr:hypothetical protein [Nanoarchaeota archaeon]